RQAEGTASVSAADVSDRAQIHGAIAETRQALGPVDLLIANAGVGMPPLLSPANIADVEQMIRVNLLGTVYAIEAVLPEMLERRQGHLAAISSLGAYKGLPGESGYCASKAAVNCYMEGLRIHLRDKGIAVTTICPGFIRTPMTAVNKFHMPWLLEPNEAARRIVRALAEGRQLEELAQMLEKEGAIALRYPMINILDAPDEASVVAWLRDLTAGKFNYVVLMTGEALRRLLGFAQRAGMRQEVISALS